MTAVWPAALVILDEPTYDVDPLRRRLLWRQIRRLAEDGAAVLLFTHNVLGGGQAVDRLAVIDQGRIVAQGTPSSLKADDRQSLRLQVNLRTRLCPACASALRSPAAQAGPSLASPDRPA